VDCNRQKKHEILMEFIGAIQGFLILPYDEKIVSS